MHNPLKPKKAKLREDIALESILKDVDDISLQRRCLFFWGAVSCLRKALLLWCYSFLVMPSVKWRPLRPAHPRKAKKTKTRRKKNQRVKRRRRRKRRRRTKTRHQVGEKSHGAAQTFRLELRTATGVFNLWINENLEASLPWTTKTYSKSPLANYLFKGSRDFTYVKPQWGPRKIIGSRQPESMVWVSDFDALRA